MDWRRGGIGGPQGQDALLSVWTLKAGRCGVCGEARATILRAELREAVETLMVAVPPLTVHVDNSTVVRGFEMGEQWCTRAGADAADLWRELLMVTVLEVVGSPESEPSEPVTEQ